MFSILIKIIYWLILILPWLSLFLAKKTAIKRYMPVTILTALLTTIIFVTGYAYDWWTLHNDIILPFGYIVNIPFNYGFYIIATFWIFYFTSHHFWIYISTQLVVNAFWAFWGLRWIGGKLLGIETLKIKSWKFFTVEVVVFLVLYAYHRWQEKIFISPHNVAE